MGLFDGLASQLGGMLGGEPSQGRSANIVGALLSGAGGEQVGGLGGMLETLAANGLADHVAAWCNGGQIPVSTDQIRDALGSQQVEQMAQASGLPVGDFLKHLADHLPAAAAATTAAA